MRRGATIIQSPIIFLDIDGVLVTNDYPERLRLGRLGHPIHNVVACQNLNRILDVTGARIVLSSSWRYCGIEEMEVVLRKWGVRPRALIDATPNYVQAVYDYAVCAIPDRHQEIGAWLKENEVENGQQFVIIDDILDMGPYADHHICTEYELGLTAYQTDRAIKILEN